MGDDQAPGPRPPRPVVDGAWRVANRVFASNTYVCQLAEPELCLLVDPGLDLEAVESAMEQLRVRPTAIFCTHGHFDHLGCSAELQNKYGARLHLPSGDQKIFRSANFGMLMAGVQGRITLPSIDEVAHDHSRYLAEPDLVEFIHAPGHTPGSSFIRFHDMVFTGDTLFRDSLGLVDFPGVDIQQLRASLTQAWDAMPDSILVCPGHGEVGLFADIKRDNGELRSFLGMPVAPSELR
jgi:glyoxylase-like metal-dependent hydrolase (beta-lactamase superfamily II)